MSDTEPHFFRKRPEVDLSTPSTQGAASSRSSRVDIIPRLQQREVQKQNSCKISFQANTAAYQRIEQQEEMLTLHTIRTSLPSQRRSSLSKKRACVCACSSEDAGSDTSPPLGGDQRQQEVLVKIAMLQTQKVRISNFLDERSDYLTKFARDADTEFDMIGQNAMKELDQVGDQIMERLDTRMQAFEETAEIQRQEIEMNERVLEDFEDWIEEEKNQGMFFKSLGKVKPKNKEENKLKAKIEAQKVREITKESAGSKTRMTIYLALMAILGITIANAIFATPEVEWRKVAALGLIFIGLVAQVIYEQEISPPGAGKNEKIEE